MLRVLQADDRPLIEQLWQLYRHDLSEARGSLPDRAGRYRLGYLPAYFEMDPDRTGYLMTLNDGPVGFVLVRGLLSGPLMIAEFFVVRACRRQGVGTAAAEALIRAHPGRWEIAFQLANRGAPEFWRRLAERVAPGRWSEERRPVPDKPQIPPDCWVMFDVAPDSLDER